MVFVLFPKGGRPVFRPLYLCLIFSTFVDIGVLEKIGDEEDRQIGGHFWYFKMYFKNHV